MPHDRVQLYGSPHSLYTGRARAYLIKAGIAYDEVAPNTEHYRKTVVPRAGGRRGMPTLELADGSVIRDGAAIIDHFEAQTGRSFHPSSPVQNFFSLLFDVFGAEGLLRPAMHYRWNFDAENMDFLKFHFRMLMPPGERGIAMADAAMGQMRAAAEAFGLQTEKQPFVEALYAEFLTALNTHFATMPYLFGGRPSIGDFGLIAPMYGHLGRDPKPLALLQANAIHVFRWVERMNRPEADILEFGDGKRDYAEDDTVSDTLMALLRVIAIDFVPETLAAAATINAWLAENSDLAAGDEVPRGVGFAQFKIRDEPFSALAQPYRFYLLARAQAAYAAMPASAQTKVTQILTETGLDPLLDTRLDREIGRADNLEVWL